ncbi:hypothetical protein [Nitrosophilus kaiyonis]|uniref:hypothetical protein n=1 Tax=Nitrosophilus kaiyonis TaxID=2930200 RepID=UPI0024919B46|nr:hypothetical protein [Nitrosophilus kaiyonis]
MNFIALLSFVILIITILTLIFGIIAYFLYKAREKKSKLKNRIIPYEEALKIENSNYLFFKKIEFEEKNDFEK